MSLVDYDSSSEEEDDRNTTRAEQFAQRKQPPAQSSAAQLPPQVPPQNQRSTASPNRQKEEFSKESEPAALKLPDAALLLSSPALASNTTGHSSGVADPMSESSSKKRDLSNPSSSSNYTRLKVPKGKLPHSKKVPETTGGNLIPPQLTGRSNVVTEDISKLFVKRQADSSMG